MFPRVCFSALLGVLVLASCAGAPGARREIADEGTRHRLITITKSENENYIAYDRILDAVGGLAETPLDVYWVMGAEDGQREELNRYEQNIYGATIKAIDRASGRIVFAINAVQSKEFETDVADGSAEGEVFTTIAGGRARVTDIHVVVRKTWNLLNPRVEVHVSGAREGSGPMEVTEIIR